MPKASFLLQKLLALTDPSSSFTWSQKTNLNFYVQFFILTAAKTVRNKKNERGVARRSDPYECFIHLFETT